MNSTDADQYRPVIEAFTTIFTASDTHDWAGLRRVLGDRVRLDWTSLQGGDPVELSGEEVTAVWKGLLGSFDATHHQLGNVVVTELEGNRAKLTAYGTATHVLEVTGQDNMWTLGARYAADLERRGDGAWCVVAITMTAVWGRGNQNLLSIATAHGK